MDEKEKVYRADTYRYRFGYDGKLRVNVLNSLSKSRFLLALKRLRKYVEKTKFVAIDSEDVGDKYTYCSWGMCCDSPKVFPDKQDHIWPEQGVRNGKVSPIELGKGHLCPHDMRKSNNDINGCFFTCAYKKYFNRRSKKADLSEALSRIDARINEWETIKQQSR